MVFCWNLDAGYYVSRAWILFKPSDLAGFLGQCPGRGREVLPCYCQMGVKVQVSHSASSIHTWIKMGGSFLLLDRGGSLAPQQASRVGRCRSASWVLPKWPPLTAGLEGGLITTAWPWKPQLSAGFFLWHQQRSWGWECGGWGWVLMSPHNLAKAPHRTSAGMGGVRWGEVGSQCFL